MRLRRLEAPARHNPGIDQHQRRALRLDTRDIGSVIKKCSAAGRLRVTKRNSNGGDRERSTQKSVLKFFEFFFRIKRKIICWVVVVVHVKGETD